jgi:3-hydroxyisobutyrate dehydrogenase-like beta-hydroxyacid dehydrogenase
MTAERPLTVVLFGLGEAGFSMAADLVGAGVEVRAFDPAPVSTPTGVSRVDHPEEAFVGALPPVDLVMAVTAASDARTAMDQAWERVEPPTVYADLATAAPGLKVELAGVAKQKDVPFVDVALMAPVPGRGLATPALACGTGSARYAAIVNGLGGRVEVAGDEAGVAAGRKLMRSIVIKGLTALLIETMELATARGDEDWLWRHLVDGLSSIDEAFLIRLLEGTAKHAGRRLHEMESAYDLLGELGVPSPLTEGVVAALRRVVVSDMPEISVPGSSGLL